MKGHRNAPSAAAPAGWRLRYFRRRRHFRSICSPPLPDYRRRL